MNIVYRVNEELEIYYYSKTLKERKQMMKANMTYRSGIVLSE